MATSHNPDHRGYTDLESLFRGDFDEGALHLELGKDALPPKPVVIWDVQTGHRRLCPAAEPNKAPESASTASTAASSADSPVPSLGAPGYLLSVAPGPNPTQRPLRHTAPGEFFAQFRRPVRSAAKDNQKRSEVLAAVTSMANEQKAMIDNILEHCDKVSRMILLATANALKESNAKAQKPMPWMTARSHIKKELAQLAGLDEVHRLLDVNQLDYPETDQTLLYCSPEERNVKAQMESFLLQSVKKFAKNQRICEFDLERVQKRLSLHSKDAEGVLNYAGHEDSGKAAQRWFKQTEALAMAALKDHETGQHKIFAGFAQTLADTTSRMSRDHMGTTGFSMSDTHVSFEHVPTNAPQGAIMLQPEERDMLQGLEMQKKQKEKAVWELKRQLDELMDKRRKMDEDVAPQTSTSEGPKTSGERRLQHAKSVKEMDEALDTLDEERFHARRSIESAGPQMAKMVDFMTTGQRNLRNLLQELKRAEQKQLEVHQQLEELVWPESKTLVHDMVRNKEMAIELLDASILPVAGSSSSIRITDVENMSQIIADSKNVSNQQLVAAARQRQQLRQEKEAKELDLEERRAAAVAAKAEKDAQNGVVTLDEAEASLGIDTSLVKDVKGMCLRGNMLLSDLRHEQKDNFVEEVPVQVAQVMEEMKEAITKTSKVLSGKLDMDNVPSLTGEFEDVEISVINLKMTQNRGTERRGAVLKRSVRHVEEVMEEAENLRPGSAGSSQKDVSAQKLLQLKEEVETNRAALAQLERRVQRMRVAVKQAESEAQSRGRVSTISSMSQLNLTQSSWPAEPSASGATEDEVSVGSEFDSDAEDLACVSTLMLPRKSSVQHAGSVARKDTEPQAESNGGSGSLAVTRQASHQAQGARPRPDPIVTPSFSQAETVERKKSLRALKHAKLVHEGLQEDLAALRRDIEELRKAKGLPSAATAQQENRAASVASPSGATQGRIVADVAHPSDNEGPVRTASGRFAQLVRSHSGKILEGVQKSSPAGFAMIGSTKALDKQRRELTNQVKTLKQEVQKKKKLLMAMVPKDNLQDLINAGVFPGEQKTPKAQDNSVDKQVSSLKNKLETLKKSVAFWQTRLENHVQKFNAMIEGPPLPQTTPGVQEEIAETSSRASQDVASSPSATSSRWKSAMSRMKSTGTLSDLSDHDPPGVIIHKSENATAPGLGGLGGLGLGQMPSLQASGLPGLQVSAVRRLSTDQGPNAPPKATDLLKKLKHAGGLVATMQRGGVLHKTAHHAVHQREALHLGQRRHSRDSQSSSVGAEGLAELVEGHGVHVAATKSNFSDIAQQAVQSVLEKQENLPPSPKKEMTRSKAFTALKREVHLLTFAAHARMTSKGNHRGEHELVPDTHEDHEHTNRLEEHRPQELDSLEDSGEESDQSEVGDTPRSKLQNAIIKLKMTNFLRKAAQEVRQEAQKAADEVAQVRLTQAPETPRLSVTEYVRNLTQAAGLPLDDADRLIDMMRLLSDQFLPFVYQQLLDMLSMPLHEQKTALKMLSLGHVDVSSPMRAKGEGAKSLGIASLLATQLLAMKQAAGLWDEKTIQANALLKTLELDQEADASGDLQIQDHEDEESGQRLLSYYKRARMSMRGQKRRFVDASSSKPFMARSIVRRPKTKTEANLELEGEQLVHERPALPPSMDSQAHSASAGPAVDPLSIDLESGLDPEELALLRRAQSWSLRPRKHKDFDGLGDAASEGMRGYRRRASRDLDDYDSDFWDDLQARVRVQKTELYEEIQEKRREEWRKLGIEGDESPRSSPSKTKGLRGNFQFGGGQTKDTQSQKFRKSNTTMELNLDPQGAALRRRFWLGDLAEEPADDLSSGSDASGIKHSKSLGDLSPGRQLRRLSHQGYVRTSSDRQVDLSPRHLRGGLAARPAIKALKFFTGRRSPSPGGFVKLEGGMVKFAADSPVDHLQSYTPRGFGMLPKRSKERALPSFHLDKKPRRGQNDFRRGSSMFRRSFTTPAQRQETMSLYERSLTRRMLGRRGGRNARSFSKNLAVQALLRKQKATSKPLARRISEVRRGSLAHQLQSFARDVRAGAGAGPGASSVTLGAGGSIAVTHYAPVAKQRRKMRGNTKPRVRVTSHQESLVPEVPKPTIRPKFDGWTKQEPGQGVVLSPRLRRALLWDEEAAPQAAAPFRPPAAPAPAPSAKSAVVAALAAQSPGEASVTEAPPPPSTMKEGAAPDAEAALELPKKMPLLPARKMAEIPVDEASARLRMNLMLFQRSRGDSPGPPIAPRQPLPQLTTTPRLPGADAADAPKTAVPAMPQFSSLKGGFTPRGRWPQSARESASRTEMDSSEVSQKAKEMLYYLQSFDRAPLQRLLSSREGPRAKTEPRRPNGDAEAKAEHLPPIKKEGGRVSSQAAAWAQFLEERLGRHLRTLSKSTPPPRAVKSREIRSLLLE